MKQLIRDFVTDRVEYAIRDSGILDDWAYEITLDLMPTADSMVPTICILLGAPDPGNIPHRLSAMTFVAGPFPEEGAIEAAVAALIEGIDAQRTANLAIPGA